VNSGVAGVASELRAFSVTSRVQLTSRAHC
jgi:hypothetical protein